MSHSVLTTNMWSNKSLGFYCSHVIINLWIYPGCQQSYFSLDLLYPLVHWFLLRNILKLFKPYDLFGNVISFFKNICLAAPGLSWGMWDLVSWPGIELGPHALGSWTLSHWTTREVPGIALFSGCTVSSHRRTILWFPYPTHFYPSTVNGTFSSMVLGLQELKTDCKIDKLKTGAQTGWQVKGGGGHSGGILDSTIHGMD